MLNYETLLSSYDDKLTLMQWLKKVEEALKDASAVSFNVNKRGDATLTFSVVFEDGSEIESNPITLQQGESVQSAYIQNGHLHLVLTNGDDLDTGNLFNGDITLSGNLTAVGIQATGTGVKTSVIQQNDESGIDFFASEVSFNNGVSAQGTIASDTSIKTPALTSDEDEISAKRPIIEEMLNYSTNITNIDNVNCTLNLSFVGCVKNGNKLTFAFAGDLKLKQATSRIDIGSFNVPQNIAERIYASSIYDWVDAKVIDFISSSEDYKNAIIGLNKYVNYLAPIIYPSTLTIGTKYFFRYECTILLSDSLI